VFNFNDYLKEFDSSKFAQAVTSQDGTYDIGGLPPQDYILGVNAEKYDDKLAYPPAYYGLATRNEAKRISLKDAEQVNGIDLVLAPPRKRVTLILDVRYEDGTVATATDSPKNRTASDFPVVSSILASVDDTNGVQRGLSNQDGPILDGKVHLSLWAGETYIVKVTRFESGQLIYNPDGSIRGMGSKDWAGTAGPIRVTEPETTLRVVIHQTADRH
jgi:hypothetical protein